MSYRHPTRTPIPVAELITRKLRGVERGDEFLIRHDVVNSEFTTDTIKLFAFQIGGIMAEDPLSGRRAHEEEYFLKKDRELIEKAREKARVHQQLRELGDQVGVTDPEVIRELAELGFTPDTVRLLPFMPILEVAWAEGGVTDPERKIVIELARARGIEAGSPADHQLGEWLDRRPVPSVFRRANRLISALFASEGRFNLTPDDIIKSSEAIAEASGGLFGIRRVSAEERATLDRIANEIKSRLK